MTPQPTPYELARQASEVFNRNLDTLVAGFLIRHPDIDPSTVRINLESTPKGMSAYVTPVQIPIPEAKVPANYADTVDGYIDGWNACRQELINTLQSMQHPPMEDGHE